QAIDPAVQARVAVHLEAEPARAAGVPEGDAARWRLERHELVVDVDEVGGDPAFEERSIAGARAELPAGRLLRADRGVEAGTVGILELGRRRHLEGRADVQI